MKHPKTKKLLFQNNKLLQTASSTISSNTKNCSSSNLELWTRLWTLKKCTPSVSSSDAIADENSLRNNDLEQKGSLFF